MQERGDDDGQMCLPEFELKRPETCFYLDPHTWLVH